MTRFRRAFAAVAGLATLWLPAVPAIAQESDAPAEAPPPTAAPRPDGEAAPRPAIWLLADADTKIYLFGTIHMLPPDLHWRSAALDRVVAESDELVLEISADEMESPNPEAMAEMELGKTAPLAWRVSEGRRGALQAMLLDYNLAAGDYDALQTWAAAMSISVAQLASVYTGEEDPGEAMAALSGVEEALTEDFRRMERPISGVETIPQQMGFFRNLPFATQREMLEQMIDAYVRESEEEPSDGDALAMDAENAGWVAGDPGAIAAAMEEMPPVLFDTLLTRRNRTWTEWLIARLDRPGTLLFAVGAGHLAGRDSVQSMLAARGMRVTRID